MINNLVDLEKFVCYQLFQATTKIVSKIKPEKESNFLLS